MTQQKKAVLITGALGGIGRAMCAEFRKSDYFVIGTDQIDGHCGSDAKIQLDIRDLFIDQDIRKSFVKDVEQILADNDLRLTALINNAAAQLLNKTEDISIEDWNVTLQTNLISPFLLIQSFLPLLSANQGSVVNVASVHATATKPEFVCYATSKSALVGMTQALAVDLGAKIRVNAICPAATATPMLLAGFEGREAEFKELARMHPIGRIALPEEIAQTAIFLCSQQASFITGSCLRIDGGIGGRLYDPA